MNERDGQRLEWLVVRYARVALGLSFLSAVADRFGLWGKHSSWGNFANFERYTAQLNPFLPAFSIPFLAWTATIAEIALGVALIAGIWPRLGLLVQRRTVGLVRPRDDMVVGH